MTTQPNPSNLELAPHEPIVIGHSRRLRDHTIILQFPTELTENFLSYTSPNDIAAFSKCCKHSRSIIYDAPDQHLWRNLLVAHFDDPRIAMSMHPSRRNSKVDWKPTVQRRIRAAKLVRDGYTNLDHSARCEVLESVLDVVLHLHPASLMNFPDAFESAGSKWLESIADGVRGSISHSMQLPRTRLLEANEISLCTKLHFFMGLSDVERDLTSATSNEVRCAARATVYDLRNCIEENQWGPYIIEEDAPPRVNWQHLDAIKTVVAMNLIDLGPRWKVCRPPLTLDSLRAYSAPDSHRRNPLDWASVEGHWLRYVCFMDYRDLFAFNVSHPNDLTSRLLVTSQQFSTTDNGPYDPRFFEDPEFQEAIRLIDLNLSIVHVATDPSKPTPTKLEPQERPTIYFEGTSRGAHGNEAKVRGSVSSLQDGEIRWCFASIYDGNTQWSSEGVQIGQVGSAAGVVGLWTGALHEEGDPAGPFWLWKVGSSFKNIPDSEPW